MLALNADEIDTFDRLLRGPYLAHAWGIREVASAVADQPNLSDDQRVDVLARLLESADAIFGEIQDISTDVTLDPRRYHELMAVLAKHALADLAA
ncbi:MAG: hypothetical protein ACKVVT_17430 [Dehalococcoidia bacterium]